AVGGLNVRHLGAPVTCRFAHLRLRRVRSASIIADVADEAETALVQRANESLVAAAVAERAPRGADAGAQCRLGDDAATPHDVDQLVLADDPIAVAHEVYEQIEDLGFDMNDRAGASKLLARGVDLEIGESEVQRLSLCKGGRFRFEAIWEVNVSGTPRPLGL